MVSYIWIISTEAWLGIHRQCYSESMPNHNAIAYSTTTQWRCWFSHLTVTWQSAEASQKQVEDWTRLLKYDEIKEKHIPSFLLDNSYRDNEFKVRWEILKHSTCKAQIYHTRNLFTMSWPMESTQFWTNLGWYDSEPMMRWIESVDMLWALSLYWLNDCVSLTIFSFRKIPGCAFLGWLKRT